MGDKMIYTKIRDVKSPKRANPTDAGIDFFIPAFNADLALAVHEKSMKVNSITAGAITLA